MLRNGGAPTTTLNLGWRHRASAAVSVAGLVAVLGRRPVAAGGSLLGLLSLNLSFYGLLARRHGPSTAAVGVGLHLVHHLVAVAAVPSGVVRYLVERRQGGGGAQQPHVAQRGASAQSAWSRLQERFPATGRR